MAASCLRALRRWCRNEQLVGSAAWDLFVIVGYYAIGIFVLDRFEGWSATDTIYFLTVTVTTIGYGDILNEKKARLADGGGHIGLGSSSSLPTHTTVPTARVRPSRRMSFVPGTRYSGW